jgi:hypothetical protein
VSPQHARPSGRKPPRRARGRREAPPPVTPPIAGPAAPVATMDVPSAGTTVTPQSGSLPASPTVGVTPPSAPVTPVVPPRAADPMTQTLTPTRAQRRAEADQARRRRTLQILAGVAAAIVFLGAVVLLVTRGGGSTPPPAATGRTQKTLAMGVSPLHTSSVVSALLGTDPTQNTGATVLLPSRLLVDAAGAGTVFYGQTASLGKNVPAESLTSTLDVTVDGTWSLTPSGLATLVDDVGGVDVTVNATVTVRNPNGSRTVLLSPGPQKLQGKAAAAYALYLAPKEPELSRLARFNAVWQGVLLGLPTSSAEVSPLVDALGGKSLATVSDASLSTFLASLAKATQAQNTTTQVLPTKSLDLSGGQTSYLVDQEKAGALIDSAFAGSKPVDTGVAQVRVLVQNGVGTPGLGAAAFRQLHKAGFAFVPGGNANHFGYKKTVVLIPDGSSNWIAEGQKVAKTLGVPQSAVMINPQGLTVADIVVILGGDYEP